MRPIFDGMKSRILRLLLRNADPRPQKKVRDYYIEKRYNETDVDIIDASTEWYGDFAMKFLSSALGDAEVYRLVDLGCGQGTTISKLDKLCVSFKKYVGIDLFVSDVQRRIESRDDRVKFWEGDIEKGTEIVAPTKIGKTVFLTVNALCYLPKLKNFLTIGPHSPARMGDDLVIVEPYPSIFWESWFSGISIHLRYPSEVSRTFELGGWELREVRKIYLFQIGGFHLWPVAFGLHLVGRGVSRSK
ncbi:MAG: class I SAM-dependent methyltransferase [Pseudomonadota bacterium]